MQTFKKTGTVALALVIGMAAAQNSAAATVEQQQEAILSCKAAAGIGGIPSLVTSLGDDPVVRIQPSDQVTEAAAARINACADRTVAGSTETVVQATTVLKQRHKHSGRSVRGGYTVPAANFLRDPRCPPLFFGLYRGNLYCFQQG